MPVLETIECFAGQEKSSVTIGYDESSGNPCILFNAPYGHSNGRWFTQEQAVELIDALCRAAATGRDYIRSARQ